MTLYDNYIQQVTEKSIVIGKLISKAVQRHLDDVEKSKDEDYPYRFDRDLADRAIKIAKLHKGTKGREFKGKPIDIQPFQAFLIAMVFGWVKKSDGYRRFTMVYFEVARKAAKSELAALIASIMAIFDGEETAEVYTAATKRDQAKEVFKAAKKMIEYLRSDFPEIRDITKIYRDSVFVTATDSVIKPLSSDHDSMDGMSVHCAVVDEYHAHKTDALLEVIRSSQGMLTQPLTFIITTAGINIQSPCYDLRGYICNVLDGVVEDDVTFGMIFALDDPETEWEIEETWAKANPMIGVTPKWDFMRGEYKTAKQRGGTKLAQFKTKNLNIWLSASSEWIPDKYVLQSFMAEDVPLEAMRGRSCVAGLDLASDYDISALSLTFPPEQDGEKYRTYRFYFIPDENAIERSTRDRVPYLKWIEQGYMITTPGDVTDYRYLRSYINSLAEIVNIECIGYDAWNSSQLIQELVEDGFATNKQALGITQLNAPTEEMGRLFRGGFVESNYDPIYRWMMLNTELEYGYNDNKRPCKNSKEEKIDGIISDLIAIATLLCRDKWDKNKYGTGVYIG